jgi:hypothetical protein
MTFNADIVEHEAPAATAAVDPRIAVAETCLCMLGGLMEIATRFSRFLLREIRGCGPAPKAPFLALRFSGNPVAVFKRVMRAARFAAVLYLRIQKQIAALKAGVPFDLDAFLAEAPPITIRAKPRRYAAWDKGEEEDWEELVEWENLYEVENYVEREPAERFDFLDGPGRQSQEDKYQALLKGPLKDAIKAICKDLGIKPDWSLWTAKGFPEPAGGGIDDWVAFFAPMAASAAPLREPRDEAAYHIWRRHWCPWRPPERARPPYPILTRPPAGGALGQPVQMQNN